MGLPSVRANANAAKALAALCKPATGRSDSGISISSPIHSSFSHRPKLSPLGQLSRPNVTIFRPGIAIAMLRASSRFKTCMLLPLNIRALAAA